MAIYAHVPVCADDRCPINNFDSDAALLADLADSVGVDLNCLKQPSAVAGEDEDLIVLGHDGVPVARLGEGGGSGAVGQGDDIGQGGGRLIVADDNQRCDEYDPRDH